MVVVKKNRRDNLKVMKVVDVLAFDLGFLDVDYTEGKRSTSWVNSDGGAVKVREMEHSEAGEGDKWLKMAFWVFLRGRKVTKECGKRLKDGEAQHKNATYRVRLARVHNI